MEREHCAQKETQTFLAVLSLMEQGVDLSQVRVQQIADAAGMGKGTLYEYFDSKEEILQRTMDYCIESGLTQARRILSESRSFSELLERCMDTIVAVAQSHASSLWISLHAFRKEGSEWWEECTAARDRILTEIRHLAIQAWQLARREEITREEESFFVFSFLTTMMGYTFQLFHMADQGELTAERYQKLQDQTRRMIDKVL